MIFMKMLDERINPSLESVFAIGVDEMSWDDLNEEHYDWPSINEVKEYRAQVREKILDFIENKMPLSVPISWNDPAWIILMGCEHARIHVETSSVLIRQLPIHLVKASADWPKCLQSGLPPINRLIHVNGGEICLGEKKENANYYGWDNEYGEAKFNIDSFMASQYLVSNREFLDFVQSGGYTAEQYWTGEGWQWRCFKKQGCPLFWQKAKNPDGYRLRLLAEEVDMPWDWPVEVNYHEAKAFCNWLSTETGGPIRLPTESEWHLLKTHELPDENYPEWRQPQVEKSVSAPANLDMAFYASSCPVNCFRHGKFYDLIGSYA